MHAFLPVDMDVLHADRLFPFRCFHFGYVDVLPVHVRLAEIIPYHDSLILGFPFFYSALAAYLLIIRHLIVGLINCAVAVWPLICFVNVRTDMLLQDKRLLQHSAGQILFVQFVGLEL